MALPCELQHDVMPCKLQHHWCSREALLTGRHTQGLVPVLGNAISALITHDNGCTSLFCPTQIGVGMWTCGMSCGLLLVADVATDWIHTQGPDEHGLQTLDN